MYSKKPGMLIMTLRLIGVMVVFLIAKPVMAERMIFDSTYNGGNCLGCEWDTGLGEIGPQSADDFLAFVGDFPRGSVALEGPGDDLKAAMSLGRAIRQSGRGTTRRGTGLSDDRSFETSLCESACVLAFMGGETRNVWDNFKLTLVGRADGAWVSPDTLSYVLDMGLSPRVLLMADALDDGQRYTLTPTEIASLGFDNVTLITDPWHIEPYKEGLVMTTVQRNGPDYEMPVTLFCRAGQGRWHILVVEPGDYSAAQYPPDVFLGADSTRPVNGPEFSFGDVTFRLGREHVDFVRATADGLSVSLILPDDIVEHGGADLAFWPSLGRVYGGILTYTVPLPSQNWMELAAKNCI